MSQGDFAHAVSRSARLLPKIGRVLEWKTSGGERSTACAESPLTSCQVLAHLRQEHISPDEIGKMATYAGVNTVVLTHLPSTLDPKDEYKRLADQVKTEFSG